LYQDSAPGQEVTSEPNPNTDATQDIAAENVDNQGESVKEETSGHSDINSGMPQSSGFNMGLGFGPAAMGGFPNMGLVGHGGDLNRMQMMMAMQNGMAPSGFGAFPMMGTSDNHKFK
jgi:hypothetical protein